MHYIETIMTFAIMIQNNGDELYGSFSFGTVIVHDNNHVTSYGVYF